MRNLFSILNLILCFELIVSPMAPSLSLVSVAHAQGCPAGLQMDPTLNRCLTTAQTANVMNATASCAQGDTACYRQNAEKAFQDKVNAGEAPERKGGGGFVSKIATIAAIAGPVTFAAIGMSSSAAKCTSPAYYAMIAGALALVIGDNLANMNHKKRLKKIKEEWGTIVNPEKAAGDKDKEREASVEAQSKSFEMLAKAEQSLADAAKMKQKFFLVASLAYGVAAALSIMEIMKEKTLAASANAALLAAKNAAPALLAGAPAVIAPNVAGTTTVVSSTGTEAGIAAAPGPSASALATAELARITASVAALNTSVPIAQAAAATVAASTMGTGAAAAQSAATLQATAASTMNAWAVHKQTVMCIPLNIATGQINQIKNESLFVQYSSGKTIDPKQELQFRYNLENSDDLVSFIMNKKEMDGELSSPLQDYQEQKNILAGYEPEDRTVFEMFKAASLMVLNEMNPISSAHAVAEVQDAADSADGSGGGGSSSGSTSNSGSNVVGNVDSNAAKAYKEDKAKGIDLLGIGLGVGIGVLLAVKSEIGAKLITSKGRAIFSGEMMGMTLLMSKHAGSQAEASEKRAALLLKMRDEFNDAAGAVNACGSADRSDPAKPTCYCYTPENQRNNSRGNSAVCQKLWAGVNLKSTNYLSKTQSGKVCISNSNKADPTCACKQTKTCLKVGMRGISGLNAGTMSMLGQSLAPVNGIANGSIDGANLNAGALGNQAAKMAELIKKIENTKGMEDFKKNKGKLEAKLMSDLNRGAASLGQNSMLGGSGSSNMPANPKEAALMLEKEIDQPLPTGVAGGDEIMAPSNSPAEEALEFGMTSDQLAAQEGQIAEVMNQDLDFGGNDINQGSKTNIFDVLSNRYQRSGMRRLFDEKGTTEAEKPAETDIAQ